MGKQTYSNGTTPDICIVGAGFSGLLAGIQLRKKLELDTFTIFDENEDVGGTWLVNTYPGCACDVQSHLYSYSFEPNPYWSYTYSPQKEIWAYLQNVAKKYDLYRKIEFKSQVKTMTWDEKISKWRVVIYHKSKKTTEERLFDLIINSPGALRLPNVPQEFKSFKGPSIHTAAWDTSVDWENKVVGVVGSGSSAIQVIPELAAKAKELHCYQRKPAWVMPRVQFKIPSWLQTLFANIPVLMLIFRWSIFLLQDFFHRSFLSGSGFNGFVRRRGERFLKKQVGDNDKLREALTPQYRVGCKRVVVSNEYYPAMKKSNVTLHRDKILKVKNNSIVTTKGEQKLDVLVLATGYQVQNYFAPMEIIGKDSRNVMDEWRSTWPKSYYGIMGSVSPNQFVLLGPNTGLGHNSIIFMIECQMNCILKLLREMMRRDAKVIEVKTSAEDAFQNEVASGMTKTVWGVEKCGSWYANAQGVITTLWPYNCLKYWRRTRSPNVDDFQFYTK